ncbi:MAG TPA: hypothetical protein VND67_10805 [Acidimicrobiales bacterium]|nr:hypothetical protein [Acidimicrobiales bacterium]
MVFFDTEADFFEPVAGFVVTARFFVTGFFAREALPLAAPAVVLGADFFGTVTAFLPAGAAFFALGAPFLPVELATLPAAAFFGLDAAAVFVAVTSTSFKVCPHRPDPIIQPVRGSPASGQTDRS